MLKNLLRKRTRGNAAVELAILFPVLVMPTLPVIDFCWYLVAWQAVTEAAQTGARTGARAEVYMNPEEVATQTAAMSLATTFPALADQTTYSAWLPDPDTIELTVTTNFVPLTNTIAMPATLTATYRMRLEHLE